MKNFYKIEITLPVIGCLRVQSKNADHFSNICGFYNLLKTRSTGGASHASFTDIRWFPAVSEHFEGF